MNTPWFLIPCSSGGAILVRGGGVHGAHPQTHVQIVPIEDARLMVAAPAMFAILQEIVDYYERNDDPRDWPIWANQARDVVAKIKGGVS